MFYQFMYFIRATHYAFRARLFYAETFLGPKDITRNGVLVLLGIKNRAFLGRFPVRESDDSHSNHPKKSWKEIHGNHRDLRYCQRSEV